MASILQYFCKDTAYGTGKVRKQKMVEMVAW